MHVLFAIKSVCLQGGGAERVLTTLMAGVNEANVRVTLLTHDRPGLRPFYSFPESVDWVRLPIGEASKATTLRNLMVRVPALRKELRRLKPDVVVAFMHSMYAPMAFAMTGMNIPLIGSEHTAREHYRSRPFEYMLANVAALRAEYVTVVSERIQNGFGYLLRRKMVPVGNPVELPKGFDQLARRKTILSVGRLGPEKEHSTLLRAFARISHRYSDWRVRIVGEGDERASLEQLVSELGIESRVDMPGAIGQIEEEYRRASIFVTSSRYESLGIATLEAMAAGLPTVGFKDCPGTNEIIHHERTGLLVDSRDRIAGLAETMERLILSDSLREELGNEAQKYAQRYSTDTILTEWKALIGRCTKSSTVRPAF